MRNREENDDPLIRLVTSVLSSTRYRHVCPEVVERVGAVELGKRKTWKEAENETRKQLHRICGSYLDNVPPYAQWLDTLRSEDSDDAFRSELRRMMLCHASTRERLPFLDEFYERTLQPLKPIRSIVDIGCGFNPLALPWMNLEADAMYNGYDLYLDMTEFLEGAMTSRSDAAGPTVRVTVRDSSSNPPATTADVALVLKFLPLLDHKNSEQTLSWMRLLNTRYAIVSFPTRTLGGRNVGMARSYEARFNEIVQAARWNSNRIEFANELCFVVELRSSENG